MAGIYIHIPFCRQACNYCNFKFSVSLKQKTELINAICKELIIKSKSNHQPIQTIYFGGGTPSVLLIHEIKLIFKTIYDNYTVIENAEITFEANPEDYLSLYKGIIYYYDS